MASSSSERATKEELEMLQKSRASLTAFHLLLRKLNEDLATMATNYRKLAAANEEWRQIAEAARVAGGPHDDGGAAAVAMDTDGSTAGTAAPQGAIGGGGALAGAPSLAQEKFVRDKLLALFASHREQTVKIKELLDELEKARPGFVSKDQSTNILAAMSDANDIMLHGDSIIGI